MILKYVEEDIVLSMNVKHLKFESADDKWEPAYIGRQYLYWLKENQWKHNTEFNY